MSRPLHQVAISQIVTVRLWSRNLDDTNADGGGLIEEFYCDCDFECLFEEFYYHDCDAEVSLKHGLKRLCDVIVRFDLRSVMCVGCGGCVA